MRGGGTEDTVRIVRTRGGTLLAALSLVAGVSVLVVAPAMAGSVINVPASQPTIQAGIDAASAGDTVLVASTGPLRLRRPWTGADPPGAIDAGSADLES